MQFYFIKCLVRTTSLSLLKGCKCGLFFDRKITWMGETPYYTFLMRTWELDWFDWLDRLVGRADGAIRPDYATLATSEDIYPDWWPPNMCFFDPTEAD